MKQVFTEMKTPDGVGSLLQLYKFNVMAAIQSGILGLESAYTLY